MRKGDAGAVVARVLVVDDSLAVRTLLATRLSAHGHEVEEAPDAEVAMDRAVASVPDVVITDLVMAGLSGVQLCRLLRSDPATAHVPVVLLTASGDKRSRFWARSAGAAAYVGKDRAEDVVSLVSTLTLSRAHHDGAAEAPARPPRRPLYERISGILDSALFDSVVAGEVRALASSGELVRLFDGLIALLSDVLSYRWVALAPARPYAPLLVHGHPSEQEACERAARAALGTAADRPHAAARAAERPSPDQPEVWFVADARATPGEGPPPQTAAISFAGTAVGRLTMAPTARGLSRDDKRMLAVLESELGGPLQMTTLYEDARRMATTDALTGLLNRRAFIEAVERERARSDRHAFPLSLLLLDVDHFKRINDVHGHAAGDAVLQGVARVLESVARRSDFVGRWGGEEFVVALPQTGEAGARVAAERLRRALSAAIHKGPAPECQLPQVTGSIGIASSEAPWSVDALVGAADEAMYSAKSRGRNRVESATRHCEDGVAGAGSPEDAGTSPRADSPRSVAAGTR
jgi:two-component system, cell cycle response regulator